MIAAMSDQQPAADLPDPEDRRSIHVELTDAGWQAWQDSVGAQAQKEALIASALGTAEKEQLNELLRRLMLETERHGGPQGKPEAKAAPDRVA